jgi:predicted PurR-regulated permease PerM
VSEFQAFLILRFPELSDSTPVMRTTLDQFAQAIQAKGAILAQGVVSSVFGVMSWLIFIVVVPVVAFYLLLDWDTLVGRIDDLLPRDHAPVIRKLAQEVDKALAGFVRGQDTVCMILGVYYATGLVAAGLQFGLVIGAIAGAMTVIPYIGALVGGALAIGFALYQFWGDWVSIGIVAAVFGFGQFVEGNVLTPRLVGKSVGLHPVWLCSPCRCLAACLASRGCWWPCRFRPPSGCLCALPSASIKTACSTQAAAPHRPTRTKGDRPADL